MDTATVPALFDNSIKIDIGCGEHLAPGWIGIDRKQGGEAYPLKHNDGAAVMDRNVADGSVDEIRASHVLEHFPHAQVEEVLKAWVRALKPGGYLWLAVPDLKWIAENYLAGKPENFQGYLMGGQQDAEDFHRTILDAEVLRNMMTEAGLVDIDPWTSDRDDCAALPVSLNLKGRKPPPFQMPKVRCAMSVPRLGFQDNFFTWTAALAPYGIIPTRYDGAYWGQCLERVMTAHADKCDWILTLDYDTVCTAEHVGRLLRLAAEHPEADAIAAMQMARGHKGKPMMIVLDENKKIRTEFPATAFETPLIKAHTAHFGLTMIRCEALRTMPHPWFWSKPNKDNLWEEGRIDDDIYFWHRWADAGKSLYVANRVVCGHAELMITWPDDDLNPIYQNPADYQARGMPDGVWQ